jgi:hypothetical protein
MRDWEVPGLALAIIRNDSVIVARGYGVTQLGGSSAVDEHTLFAIASTTKAMTVRPPGHAGGRGAAAVGRPGLQSPAGFPACRPVDNARTDGA